VLSVPGCVDRGPFQTDFTPLPSLLLPGAEFVDVDKFARPVPGGSELLFSVVDPRLASYPIRCVSTAVAARDTWKDTVLVWDEVDGLLLAPGGAFEPQPPPPPCFDGRDNDRDGLIDDEDDDCAVRGHEGPAACNDGIDRIDNDLDGQVDVAGDWDCRSKTDDDERLRRLPVFRIGDGYASLRESATRRVGPTHSAAVARGGDPAAAAAGRVHLRGGPVHPRRPARAGRARSRWYRATGSSCHRRHARAQRRQPRRPALIAAGAHLHPREAIQYLTHAVLMPSTVIFATMQPPCASTGTAAPKASG
jgi:hypothetical protein